MEEKGGVMMCVGERSGGETCERRKDEKTRSRQNVVSKFL